MSRSPMPLLFRRPRHVLGMSPSSGELRCCSPPAALYARRRRLEFPAMDLAACVRNTCAPACMRKIFTRILLRSRQLVRRGPGNPASLCPCDDAGDRDEKGASFRARRAAERGSMRSASSSTRHYRSRKGRSSRKILQAMLLSAGRNWSARSESRAASHGCPQRNPTSISQTRPLGSRLSAVVSRKASRWRAGSARNRAGEASKRWRDRRPARPLGRLPSRGGTIDSAGPQRPPARPAVLPEGGRCLEKSNGWRPEGQPAGSWEGDGLEAPPGPEKPRLDALGQRVATITAFGIPRLCSWPGVRPDRCPAFRLARDSAPSLSGIRLPCSSAADRPGRCPAAFPGNLVAPRNSAAV